MAIETYNDPKFDDILENPQHYGMPSFEEFRKNPDKFRERWHGKTDDVLGCVSNGSTLDGLKSRLDKDEYYIWGYKARNLEEVERIAKAEGVRLNVLEPIPELIPTGHNGEAKMKVTFMTKAERLKRASW